MEKNKDNIIESENLQAQYEDRAAQYDVRDNALNARCLWSKFHAICAGCQKGNSEADKGPRRP